MRGRELFLEAGGTSFGLIPCLNERPDWIEALAGIARRTLAGKPDKVAA
jgi:ferrochelatase